MQFNKKISSAFFITFSGDCKKAFTLYQQCFGGDLFFDVFEESISGVAELPVISGSLVSEKITLYGSDLVHNEGRRVGNFISLYIHCRDFSERLEYIKKLDRKYNDYFPQKYSGQKLVEITDCFDVRWVFGV